MDEGCSLVFVRVRAGAVARAFHTESSKERKSRGFGQGLIVILPSDVPAK